MSSLKRQIKRNQKKKWLKQAKKGLRHAALAGAGLPTHCTQCHAEFDGSRDADSWIVDLNPSTVQLLCPNCSGARARSDT